VSGPAGNAAADPTKLQRPDLAAQMVADILKQKIADVKETRRTCGARGPRRRNWKRWLVVLIPRSPRSRLERHHAGAEPRCSRRTSLAPRCGSRSSIAAQGIRPSAIRGMLPVSLQQIAWPMTARLRPRRHHYVIVGSAGAVHVTTLGDDLKPYGSAAHTLARSPREPRGMT